VGKPSLNAVKSYAKAKGRVFLLVPAYPGCPGTKAVKRLLLLLLLCVCDDSQHCLMSWIISTNWSTLDSGRGDKDIKVGTDVTVSLTLSWLYH